MIHATAGQRLATRALTLVLLILLPLVAYAGARGSYVRELKRCISDWRQTLVTGDM